MVNELRTAFAGLCLGAMFLIGESATMADDWPQWRGPQRDGVSSETGLLPRWPPQGPKLLWETSNLGSGYSTPAVVGDQLFVVANQGMDKEEVIAISTVDGHSLWKTMLGKVGQNQGPQYPGSRSTPTVSGDFLYALGSDGDLACIEIKSGRIEWNKNLRRDFQGKPGMWAFAESPLIDGDRLICSPGGSDATVVALNKADGSVVWKVAVPNGDGASFSSPIVATIDGVRQYVAFLSKGVVGLRADDGEFLWRYSRTSDAQANIATPIVKGNLVYTGASRVGAGLVEVRNNAKEPKEVYFAKSLPSAIGGSVLVDGNLFGSAGATMMCIDYESGNVKWQDRGIGTASLLYADGRLYLHGEDNVVAMISASDKGFELLGSFSPPNASDPGKSKAWTYPVLANGRLYIRDLEKIWCYDVQQ